MAFLLVFVIFAGAAVYILLAAAKVVPQQEAWIVERVGRYYVTLRAGLHIIVPFVDTVRQRHSLKETVIPVEEQDCITKDNVLIKVDAVLYYQIIDPVKATYGISNHQAGIIQLAQTTVRAEIGKIELDRTFEERSAINAHIVAEIDKASEAWGVKVLRYEIKNIKPPDDIREAMERQMRAERTKRALILESEGQRDSVINTAEGRKQEDIKASEGRRLREINEAEGHAAAIRAVASAIATSIKEIAQAIQEPGGMEAVQLRVAEQYIQEFGKMAKTNNTMIVAANVADAASMISTAMTIIRKDGSTRATDKLSPTNERPGGGN